MVLNEGQEIDYDPSTFRPFLGPLHSLILRMCMYCSPLPCFPRFPVPSLSEKWPPFPSTTIRASRRCCEEGGRARRPLGGEGERGRGAEGQRPLVHTHIFSQMNSLLLLLYRSLLLPVPSHLLDPPPNCQTTYMDLAR